MDRNWLYEMLNAIKIAGLLMISITMISCFDDDGDKTVTTCDDFGRIIVGQYIVDNNVWAKGDITNYQQCVWAIQGSNPLQCGWNWNWPSVGDNMKSIPQIHYGWTWWEPLSSTTSKLPIKISNLGDIYAYYDTTISATGQYNTTFSLWLTSGSVPSRETLTREIMIWVDTTTPNGAHFIKRVTIDGEEYDLHVNYDWNYWTYIAFIKVIPKPSGSLKLSEFLKFLQREQYFTTTEYLASIQFGNEVKEGIGEVTVNSYWVDIK